MAKGAKLEGKTFGRLEVLEYSKPDKKWRCKCICGEVRLIEANNLTAGKSQSCGCLRREITSKRMIGNTPAGKLKSGEGSLSYLINRYVQTAKKRDITFELNREEFRFLTEGDCNYCGREPNQKIKGPRSNGEYTYNGIDRLNSNEGYNYSNCVSCCSDCNIAKMDKTVVEFYGWIQRMSSYLRKLGEIE